MFYRIHFLSNLACVSSDDAVIRVFLFDLYYAGVGILGYINEAVVTFEKE